MIEMGPITTCVVGAMIAVSCALLLTCLVLKLDEWGIHYFRIVAGFAKRSWFERLLLLFMIGGLVQYAATKGTNGNDRAAQNDSRVISDSGSKTGLREGETESMRQLDAITNLCFTSISVSSNFVTLEVAWPMNFFANGTILDYFIKPYALTNAWQWFGSQDVHSGETNQVVTVDSLNIGGTTNQPSALFFKVQDRLSSATTMADADDDGLPDAEEIDAETDPKDLYSFYRRITVVTTTTDNLVNMTNYVAWGTSATGWETNDQSSCWTFPATNVYDMISSSGPMYIKSFRDLNCNGRYDSELDIISITQVPPLDAISSFTLCFGDVDGDGVFDATERQEGTDPYDSGSFRLRATVNCANTDIANGVTNYLGVVGSSENGRVSFVASGTLTVDTLLTNGICEVFCLRDFNGNGVFDEGVDVRYSRTLTKSDNGKALSITIGDADSDGQSDSSERSHGTNPEDARSYCFNLSIVERGIFSTTNALTAEILFGTNLIVGPLTMTNRTWAVDAGHLVASNRETITAYFWDDANSNGVRDAEECYAQQTFTIKGHDNVLTNTLSMGTFDRDNDGMLDYWELLHTDAGLSPTNAADAFLDADSDGLSNLYEFKFGLDPNIQDATNLAFAVACRSVDERLQLDGVTADRFVNYVANGSTGLFVQNTNFWAAGIDMSCASMWHTGVGGHPDCAPTNTSITAISSHYVIYANHFGYAMSTNLIYYFFGDDGCVYTNRLVSFAGVGCDIGIGRLEHELPSCVHPAKFLPDNFAEYFGTGAGLPLLTLDQNERAVLHDLGCFTTISNRSLLMSAVSSPNPLRSRFGKTFIGGDSSSPRFIVVNDQVVILGTLWKGGSGSCCHATLFKQEIQNRMQGETLSIIDLSEYERIPNEVNP